METLSLNLGFSEKFISKELFRNNLDRAKKGYDLLMNGNGEGNDFLGWINLPSEIDDVMFAKCRELKEKWVRLGVETVISIGIGGSYLGAECALKALSPSFGNNHKVGEPELLFAGQNISEDYLYELCEYIKNKNFALIVISKSGTTTEPAIAFRILREIIEKRYGKLEAAKRIVAITDAKKGILSDMANKEGYMKFIIPDNVGGRYSVLTPVGLVPLAVAGFDIEKLVRGAICMQKECAKRDDSNIALRYAAMRNSLYSVGKKIEILVTYNPKLRFFGEWWKQLFGESEGKEGKGIFPASVNFTTDLHSMGQYIQEGERIMFETTISVNSANHNVVIESDRENLDGLNFIAGKRVEDVNKMAQLGTIVAHDDGGVPSIIINVEKIDEYYLGLLFYFFEFACGISGYILGINPFNQPGVESYKKNMFALMGKPGYGDKAEEILKRFNK